jgi:hypothetical protein
MLVQAKFPRFGDRLLSVVELSDAEQLPVGVSRGLIEAAMAQVATEAEKLDFTASVPTRAARRWLPGFVLLALLVTAAFVMVPSAGRNAVARWLRPWAAVPRFTFTWLERLPEKRVVAYGEAFVVESSLAPQSQWRPSSGRARFEKQMAVNAGREEERYRFAIPGQTKPGELVVAVGDARDAMRIEPVFRPDLAELTAMVELPGYLGYPSMTVDARKGAVELVEGSSVAFSGRVSRALSAVTMSMGTLQVRGDRFVSEKFDVAGVTNVAFAWRDLLGMEGRQPLSVKMETRADAAPGAEFAGLQRVVAILEEEVLEFEAQATDDFGVKQAGLAWEYATSSVAEPTKHGAWDVKGGGQQARTLRAATRFAPKALGVGPGRVTLRATAVDYFPARTSSVSEPYTVFILDKAEHAKLIEQQLEKLNARLEEIVRTEENQFDTSQRLKEMTAEELKSVQTTKELAATERGEQGNREAAKQLQKEFEKLAKEALRNPTIAAKQIKEWSEVMELLQRVAKQEMAAAQQALKEAGESQQGEARKSEVGKAQEQQAEALKKLKAALQQMSKAGEQLAADNFVNRLRACASAEKQIGASVTEVLPKTVGMRREDLGAEVRKKVEGQESEQRITQKRVGGIATDMEYLIRRSKQPAVEKVRDEIEKANAIEQLGSVADLIRENMIAQAMQETARWEKQLTAWAEMLGSKKDGGGGGGGGGGQTPPELIELMVKLMRIRQQEQELREQTRALDETKAQNPEYAERAEALAKWQHQLREQIEKAPAEVNLPEAIMEKLDKLFDATVAAMADARQLLSKPETGGETLGAETEVIELLSQSTDQCSSQCQQSGGAQMEALMQMMRRMFGMGQGGTTPGGNWSGGTTSDPSGTGSGDASSGRGGRTVEKAGVQDSSGWPAEFRDALEGFFNALEGEKR